MAKTTTNTTKMATPKIGWRGVNEFIQPDDRWHAHIQHVEVLASDDGFKAPKIVFSLVGPGTLGALKVDVKLPYEGGLISLPNGEVGFTELTQLCIALDLLRPEDLNNEEFLASFSYTAAIGLAIRCQTVRQEVVKKVGVTSIVTRYTTVVPSSIELEA